MIEKVTTELIVGVGLCIGLIAAEALGMNELAMSIASGLVGYMGGKEVSRHEHLQ